MRIITFVVLLAAALVSLAFAQPSNPANPVAMKPSQAPADDTAGQSADGTPGTVTLEGTLGVTISCDFENGRSLTEYTLQTDDGATHMLDFSPSSRVISGMRLRVSGARTTGGIRATAYTVVEAAVALGTPEDNLGEQRTIVVLVNSTENAIQPITPTEAGDRVFNATRTDSINSWVKEVSYQRTFLSGDVSGWHTLSLTRAQLCQQGQSGEQAILNAVDSSVNFTGYQRVVIVFPDYSSCGFSGIATLGKQLYTNDGGVTLSVQRLNGAEEINNGVGAHEFGHNFGAGHAHAWNCGDNIIGGSCLSKYNSYGDFYDVLGFYTLFKGHFNAVHKDIIGWFDSNEILQIGNENGAYVLTPLETVGGLKALRIPANGFNVYVEYRRPIGYDNNIMFMQEGLATLGRDIYRGAMIHTDVFASSGNSSGDSQLLDMLPLPPTPLPDPDPVYWDAVDVVLEIGATFSYNGLNLTPTKLNDASLTVCVEVGDHFDADADGVPDTCDVCPGFNDAQPCPIPTVSAWGLGVLTLSLLLILV